MKKCLTILACALLLASCHTAPLSVEMVRSQMTRCPEAALLDYGSGKLKWSYTPGLELKAYLDVYETYGGQEIYDYVHAWYD